MTGSAPFSPQPQGLFDRLPERIFGPLASPNRRHYWRLLLRLNERCFGPDAPTGMEDGILHGRVTREIQDALEEDQAWLEEADDTAELTPPNVRANMVLTRLVEAGWLVEVRVGARFMVTMRPTVQKFLELLKRFADEGPMFVAGKVQLIFNTLEQIEKHPAKQAHAFEEASEQAQSLISMLNSTAARVREVIDVLSQTEATATFVEGFFTEYVSTLFLKDYQSLRTENHPLRFRHDIVRIARTLRDEPERREQMLTWYRSFHTRKTPIEVESIYEKHVARFLRFEDVERHLDRLDEAVSLATRRALSNLHYRLRSQGRIDRLVGQAITLVIDADRKRDRLPFTFGSGPLFTELALRPPRTPRTRPRVNPIRRPQLTDEQKAEAKLRSAMTQARLVTHRDLVGYLSRVLAPGQTVGAEVLPVQTPAEMMIFLALSHGAFMSRRVHGEQRRNMPIFQVLRDIQVMSLDQEMETDLLIARRFEVTFGRKN